MTRQSQFSLAVFLSLLSAGNAGCLDFFTKRTELRAMEVVSERQLLLELEKMRSNGQPCLALDIDETLSWTGYSQNRA
jgi:hypothetical protein